MLDKFFLQTKVQKIEENDRSRSLQCLLMKSYGCCDHIEGFWKNFRPKNKFEPDSVCQVKKIEHIRHGTK